MFNWKVSLIIVTRALKITLVIFYSQDFTFISCFSLNCSFSLFHFLESKDPGSDNTISWWKFYKKTDENKNQMFGISEGGGELTHYMTGNESKLKDGRPSTEPLFSRGTFTEFTEFRGLRKYQKTNYIDLIRFFTHDNQKTLIWQSIHDNHISSVFGHHKKYNDKKKQFWVSSSFKEVKEQMKVHSKSGFNIYSLAVDQKSGKFYPFMQERFGTAQIIVQTEDPEDHYMPGLSVTSVTCLGKTYFLVVTAGVNGYENKDQTIFTSRSRSELDTEIKRQRDKGMVITSFCVNSDQKEYLTVMTEMEGQGQERKWWDISTADGSKWASDIYSSKKFVYTIVCTDPSDDQRFCLMTEDDNRSGYFVQYASFFTWGLMRMMSAVAML